MPAGEFRAIDGRPGDGRAWRIDRAVAEKLIAVHKARTNPIAIDYEHQTLHAAENGQPAPAAGWIKSLEWREGAGLYAKVDWTDRAKAMIAAGEYRFISPMFRYDPNTLEPKELAPAALVNYPAIDGMQEVALNAIANAFARSITQENTMNPLLAALLAALGLPADVKQEAAVTAVEVLKTSGKTATDQVAALTATMADASKYLPAADVKKLKDEIAALKAAGPDPAKYVPIETVNKIQTELAALTAAHQAREIDELISGAIEDGKLLPDMEKWARELGKKSLADLKSYIESASPIAALAGTQTRGRKPTGSNAGKDPMAIAKAAQVLMDAEAKAGRILPANIAVDRVMAAA